MLVVIDCLKQEVCYFDNVHRPDSEQAIQVTTTLLVCYTLLVDDLLFMCLLFFNPIDKFGKYCSLFFCFSCSVVFFQTFLSV